MVGGINMAHVFHKMKVCKTLGKKMRYCNTERPVACIRGNCSKGFKIESLISGKCRIVKGKTTDLSAGIYKTVVCPPGIHFSRALHVIVNAVEPVSMAAGYNGNLPFTVPRIQIPNTYNNCNLPATLAFTL